MNSATATTTIMMRLHGRTAAGVPRWAVWTAYATALTALPSGIWRIAAMNFGVPLVEHGTPPPGSHAPVMFDAQWWYIVGLSVVSEAVAFLTVGLVAEWGEVWPRWVPGLRGRRVPVLAAVVPAGIGAALLLVFPYALVMSMLGMKITGEPDGLIVNGWQSAVFYLTYAPLAFWGPLLAVVTVHYYRRRTGDRTDPRGGGSARSGRWPVLAGGFGIGGK